MKHLLPPKAQYKTALHCHSTVSDGALTPEELKTQYKAQGFSAVAYTDHDIFIRHNDLSDDGFVALNGYELTVKSASPAEHTGAYQKVYHFCFIARSPDTEAMVCFSPEYCTVGNVREHLPFVTYTGGVYKRHYSVEGANEIIDLGNRNGFLVAYNHPRWSLQTPEDYIPLKGLTAVEVYNEDARHCGDCNAEPYDAMLRGGIRPLSPIATDDLHKPSSLGKGWVMLAAEELSYTALTDAYAAGDLYASTGPEIFALYTDGDTVTVKSSPAREIVMRTDARIAKAQTSRIGGDISEATFRLPNTRYFRIEVYDRNGNTAWTRAYFKDEWA